MVAVKGRKKSNINKEEEMADQMTELSVVSLTTNITSLPDLCLDRILDHLPLPDLLTITPLVCWRWYHSRASACRRRHTLLLLQHPSQMDSVLKYPLGMGVNMKHAVDGKGKSLGHTTEDLVHLKGSVLTLSYLGPWRISFDALSNGLLGLFTNITDLRLVQTTGLSDSDLVKVHLILHRLGPKLHTLYLILSVSRLDRFEGNPTTTSSNRQQPVVYDHISTILELINTRMRPRLRRLLLNLQVPQFTPFAREPVLSDLSILDQLEEFEFCSYGLSIEPPRNPVRRRIDPNEPLDALEQYAANNPRGLASIKVGNPISLARAVRLPASVAASFTQLPLGDWIARPNVDEEDIGGGRAREDLRALATFCQLFHSVRVLFLPLSQTIAWEQMVERLSGLRQLASLTLVSDQVVRGLRHYSAAELEQYRRDRAMPSVIDLTVFVSTRAHHGELAMLQLPTFFPNTQVVLVRHSAPHGCARCRLDRFGRPNSMVAALVQRFEHNIDLNNDDWVDPDRPMARCMALALRPFAQFGRLSLLRANRLFISFADARWDRSEDRCYTREQLAAI